MKDYCVILIIHEFLIDCYRRRAMWKARTRSVSTVSFTRRQWLLSRQLTRRASCWPPESSRAATSQARTPTRSRSRRARVHDECSARSARPCAPPDTERTWKPLPSERLVLCCAPSKPRLSRLLQLLPKRRLSQRTKSRRLDLIFIWMINL